MISYVADPDFTLYVGDVREVLASLPDESVHCVVTSPPYWGLRDYGVEGQLGLEPTPEEYVANMVAVSREVRRVLRRDGTCWLNLGDSYASGPKHQVVDSLRNGPRTRGGPGQDEASGFQEHLQGTAVRPGCPPGFKPKDLVGIPWRVAFALQADGWYLRSDIIWAKPNPMPESVTDRPTKAHEYLFLLTRSARYFYDADAIREDASWDRWSSKQTTPKHTDNGNPRYAAMGREWTEDELARYREGGRNARSVWQIATQPYPDAHFATFPEELPRRCILAGTSERGCCPECGAPWERVTSAEYDAKGRTTNGPRSTERRHETAGFAQRLEKRVETTGWQPSCDCVIHTVSPQGTPYIIRAADRLDQIPCVVLDPFLGSGTTALVARRHGRKSIGIELSSEYAQLAARRLSQLSLLADGTAA